LILEDMRARLDLNVSEKLAILFLFGLLAYVLALPRGTSDTSVFLLAGDSTTATQSPGGGGWGDGFKNFTLIPPSFAINYGHDGATTSSFMEGPDWDWVVGNATDFHAMGFTVYVTIQFGHNDMKLANFSDTFKSNLALMSSNIKSIGGTPVLVTSLSRRNYFANGTIDDTLGPWADYAREVAAETNTDHIDLWAASIEYLEKIGEVAADRMNLVSNDTTHLNVAGSIVFGRMVSDLLVAAVPGVEEVTKKNETLSRMIAEGIPSV